MEKGKGKEHTHRYKTIVIDSRGTRHQRCKCREKRTILEEKVGSLNPNQ